MTAIKVYLEDGFDHDRVVVTSAGSEHTQSDVTTRHQVGLASVVEVEPSPDASTTLRVDIPGRGLHDEVELDPVATPYVRVSVADGALQVRPQHTPPMFA